MNDKSNIHTSHTPESHYAAGTPYGDADEIKHVFETLCSLNETLEHDVDTVYGVCGHCYHQSLMGKVAKDILGLIVKGQVAPENAFKEWSETVEMLWRESKFVHLFNEEKAAGRDPKKAFETRGWML